MVNFQKSKEHTFEFLPKPSMGSSISVVVYYISDDGEIVSDKVDVNIDTNLPNYVSQILY